MTAILRIQSRADETPAQAYVDRLVKLIPAEVVALYLTGRPLIQPEETERTADDPDQRIYWLVWTLVCLVAVLVVRRWATSDPTWRLRPQWNAVIVAAISFLVWVYSLGDVFRGYGLWSATAAALAVLAWTFFAPFLVPTPVSQPEPEAQGRPAKRRARRLSHAFAAEAVVPPADITEAQAQLSVLDGVDDLTGATVSLSDPVSGRFSNARQVRRLLGVVQDLILARHEIVVELADRPEAELEALRQGAYRGLALWVRTQVQNGGRASHLNVGANQ